ncbi:MAG: hypothetical protein KAI77_08735 [Gammaproteobacteria bacterium]|nr:hypothetical protein [Gammaproteobacteria bacterium]
MKFNVCLFPSINKIWTILNLMKTISLIILVLSVTITMPVTASDKDGMYMSRGDISCGEWSDDRKNGGSSETTATSWILGYISAYNAQTPDVYDITSGIEVGSISLSMDKFCRVFPLSHLSDGVQVLIESLWPNRQRTADDVNKVRDE